VAPQIVEPERIAARREVDDAPLFTDRSLAAEDHRQQKTGGFFSLFGRQRQEAPQPPPLRDYRSDPTPVIQARAAAVAAQQAAQPASEEHADSAEDLEIPSFLRRLAN
jgi:cell division protein FtsZ